MIHQVSLPARHRFETGVPVRSEFALPRGPLELADMLSKARSAGDRTEMGV